MTAFWINMIFIILCAFLYMAVIEVSFFIAPTKDDDEDKHPKKIDYEKRCTEKDLFINAYINMFNETVENATDAYRTTDVKTRRILINEYEKRSDK